MVSLKYCVQAHLRGIAVVLKFYTHPHNFMKMCYIANNSGDVEIQCHSYKLKRLILISTFSFLSKKINIYLILNFIFSFSIYIITFLFKYNQQRCCSEGGHWFLLYSVTRKALRPPHAPMCHRSYGVVPILGNPLPTIVS